MKLDRVAELYQTLPVLLSTHFQPVIYSVNTHGMSTTQMTHTLLVSGKYFGGRSSVSESVLAYCPSYIRSVNKFTKDRKLKFKKQRVSKLNPPKFK